MDQRLPRSLRLGGSDNWTEEAFILRGARRKVEDGTRVVKPRGLTQALRRNIISRRPAGQSNSPTSIVLLTLQALVALHSLLRTSLVRSSHDSLWPSLGLFSSILDLTSCYVV
ncbi:hypothetical protein G7K_5176-t1 [Saitoella complicata NRRL Y-17804]|uniref:Uncharacterized protein n=1 Tax=Saitoella complicata (strain BCRC 22490 / CBS 7301 / JCM 7358 / NBRC 10748 / NRRL Y-17804) TaxID=698492 RepID=A0A0E9NMJ2_SAICN|nr:hypothetical protein G7K_5176-t1 [Saitoella complicata NRRL Y-17804]